MKDKMTDTTLLSLFLINYSIFLYNLFVIILILLEWTKMRHNKIRSGKFFFGINEMCKESIL
jgi:hypothetical protein